MQVGRFLAVLGLGGICSACAIHPLPEDVSRSSTADIVQKIRCEGRTAIIRYASIDGENFPEEKLRRIVSAGGPNAERDIRKLLKPRYQNAAIGYDFRLTISESDGSSASTTFTFPFGGPGKFLLGIGGGEAKERKADRSFDIVEYFWEVLAEPIENCLEHGKNWKYPITGDVGLDEVLKTYIRIDAMAGLKGSLAKRSNSQDITFTDELTFTTSFNASVQPSLELSPVIHDLRVTRAAASFGGERKDIHKVTVALVTEFTQGGGGGGPQAFSLDGASRAAGSTKAQAKQNLFRRRTEGLLEKLDDQ
jgi:hypothetical protein